MNTIDTGNMAAKMRLMAAQAAAGGTAAPNQVGTSQDSFGDLLKGAVDKVNEAQQSSGDLKTAFAKGATDVNLAEVMVASQKAGVAFQAMLQVRNRLVSAYQEIMSMPL